MTEIQYLSSLLGLVTMLAGFGWWLSKQFERIRKLVYEQFDRLRDLFDEKLEEHEKHDVKRFEHVVDEIWQIKIRNAARDGLVGAKDLKPRE